MNSQNIWSFLSTHWADYGLKLLGALAAWVIGRWLIGFALRLMGVALSRGAKVDQTLANYSPQSFRWFSTSS